MIKAVLYDLGDIFFEAHEWRKWNYEQLKKQNLFTGSFADFYFLYESFLKKSYENIDSYDNCFKAFLQHLNVKDIEGFTAISYAQKKKLEEERELYPGVKETLEKLHKLGIKNIVITDNELPEDDVRKNVIGSYEINHLIDKVITSYETGVQKPHPNIFQAALNSFKLDKKEVLFVAHDKDELDGAALFGIKTIEFNNYLGIPIKADYSINLFNEIFILINPS